MNLARQLLHEVLGVMQQFKSRESAQDYITDKNIEDAEVVQVGDRFQISLMMLLNR